MGSLLLTVVVLTLTLAAIGYMAGRRSEGSAEVRRAPPLQLLPGDIKYESPSGNVRIYFPIVTSLVLSVVLSLVLRLLG